MVPPAQRATPATILLVDDEEMLRGVMVRTLEDYGYRVIAAADGAAAWELLQDAGDTIHAIITDVVMPRMNGLELAERVSTLPTAPPLMFHFGLCTRRRRPGHPFFPSRLRSNSLPSS